MSLWTKFRDSIENKLKKVVIDKLLDAFGSSGLVEKIKTAKAAADAVDESNLTDAAQFIQSLKDQGFGDDLIAEINTLCSTLGYDSAKIDKVFALIQAFVDEASSLVLSSESTSE